MAIEALGKDAVPVEIRDLHIKHLKSPVHPMAVYPTLNALHLNRYVVKSRKRHSFEKLGFSKHTWQYTVTEASHAFMRDYFEEVDTMRRLMTNMRKVVKRA